MPKNKGVYPPRTKYKLTYRDPDSGNEFTEEYDSHDKVIKESVRRRKEGYEVSLFRLIESLWKKIF